MNIYDALNDVTCPSLINALELIGNKVLGTQYEGRVWYVGGFVRDLLLGREEWGGVDIDLVTTEPIEPLTEILFPETVEHHSRFGTAITQLYGHKVEVVRTRTESYHAGSRKPTVKPGTLVQDAFRRDLTINALYADVVTGALFDPTGRGLADLSNGELNTPLNPDDTLYDDPLRILRTIRFNVKLNRIRPFKINDHLYVAMRSNAHRLPIVSQERIRAEIEGAMVISPTWTLWSMEELGILKYTALEPLRYMVGLSQSKYHIYSAWAHTVEVVRNMWRIKPDIEMVWAAILHDCGKPFTKRGDHFYDHDIVGVKVATEIMTRLKFSNRSIRRITDMVKYHMRVPTPKWSPSACRRFMAEVNGGILPAMGDKLPNTIEDLLILMECDSLASNPEYNTFKPQEVRDMLSRSLAQSDVRSKKCLSPLNGVDIMSITGMGQCSAIGVIKQFLHNLVLDGQLHPNDAQSAEDILRRMPLDESVTAESLGTLASPSCGS